MLEIEKLRQDILAQNVRLKREDRQLWIAAIGGAAAFVAASAAFGKLFFGG